MNRDTPVIRAHQRDEQDDDCGPICQTPDIVLAVMMLGIVLMAAGQWYAPAAFAGVVIGLGATFVGMFILPRQWEQYR
jgi:hypothetical protein